MGEFKGGFAPHAEKWAYFKAEGLISGWVGKT